MIRPRPCDARTRKTQRLRLEALERRDVPGGASTAHALALGMPTDAGLRSAEIRTGPPVADPTQSVAAAVTRGNEPPIIDD